VGSISDYVGKLREIVGDEGILHDSDVIYDYLRDESAPAVLPKPANNVIVVKPKNVNEVSMILKFANEKRIPVFPRGGGTGLVGGAIPTIDGIVLSLERMNKVIEVDRENMMIIVEAGVTLANLIKTAEDAGLFFPPHPGDESATVGGLIACNAGGARAVKYGVMRSYVLGLEAVLPTGDIITLGGKIIKNVAGYDLMHLFIGSEGTLGIITKAVLKLNPKPGAMASLVIAFNNPYNAIGTVPKILQAGIKPLAMEYIERDVAENSAKLQGLTWRIRSGRCFLYIILENESIKKLLPIMDRIDEIAKSNGSVETFVALSRRDQEELLAIRSKMYLTLKRHTLDILDVAVPPAYMAKLIEDVLNLAKDYGIEYIPIYGHAGDGNLHIHILNKESGGIELEKLDKFRDEIYRLVINLGGTITAEHGVGIARLDSFIKYTDNKVIQIMASIKKILDPNNILNPGKVIPINYLTSW